jgi:tetratricopeptide (TPR) repeat protein
VEFRALGPIELWADEHEHDLGLPKERCVLAVLLLAAGHPVSAEKLIDHVWGDDPPTRDALYPHIARLRRKLRRINHHQRALSIAQEIAEPYEQARAHLGLGDAHRENSRHTVALEHYHTALGLARDLGAPYEEGQSLHGMAETLLHLQGPAVAKAYWQQALSLFQQLGVPEVESVRIRLHTLGATGA